MSQAEFLQIALQQAQSGAVSGQDAAGAVLVKDNEVIATSPDRRLEKNNPIATAEMECIRLAGRRNDQASWKLISTHYPNMLIAGTILQFSIGALVIGREERFDPVIELLKSKGVSITFCPDHE